MTVKAIHDCVERLDFSGKEIFRSRSCSEVIVKSLVRQFAQPVLFCSRLNPIFSEANGGELQRAAICRQRFFYAAALPQPGTDERRCRSHCGFGSRRDSLKLRKMAVKLEVPDAPGGKANGGERNQTLAAVIANHPFTNAFVRTSSQSLLGESMSDQPNRRPDEANLAASMPAQKT
jgi:hypothetical protein